MNKKDECFNKALFNDIDALEKQKNCILSIFDAANEKLDFNLAEAHAYSLKTDDIIKNHRETERSDSNNRSSEKTIKHKKSVSGITFFKRIGSGISHFFEWFGDHIDSVKCERGELFCLAIASMANLYNLSAFIFGYNYYDNYFNAHVSLICGIIAMLFCIPSIVKFFKEEGSWIGVIYSIVELFILIGDIIWFCSVYA